VFPRHLRCRDESGRTPASTVSYCIKGCIGMSRRTRTGFASPLQPDLFSVGTVSQPSVIERSPPAAAVGKASVDVCCSPGQVSVTPIAPKPTIGRARDVRARAETRIVSHSDLPEYPALDQELVDRSIAALPPGRIWFTYAAIKECFGISRATVARKVKKGLVPGIRFRGTSVLEDGPVRRFDRSQLRWLLLAVRSQP
jgi:hypothetical protein